MGSIEGLGVINTNNSSANIQSPSVQNTMQSEGQKLSLAASILNAEDNCALATCIYNWAIQFPEVSAEVSQAEIIPGYYGVKFKLDERIYDVVAVRYNKDIAGIINLGNYNAADVISATMTSLVVLCREEITAEQIKGLTAIGADYITAANIQTIDQAAASSIWFVPTDKRFYSVLALTLNKTTKKSNSDTLVSNTKQEFSNLGSGLKQSFVEGFSQLKESISAAATAIGINKNSNAQSQNQQQAIISDVQSQQVSVPTETDLAIPTQCSAAESIKTDCFTAELTKTEEVTVNLTKPTDGIDN